MAAKFTDKLAEQALEQALDNHAEVIQRQRELIENKQRVEGELKRLEEATSKLEGGLKSARIPDGIKLSAAAIDEISCNQDTELDELKKQHTENTRRLRLYVAAIHRVTQEKAVAKSQEDKARTTLAASFERHTLASGEVKKALTLLRQTWAVWAAATGSGAFFNAKTWSETLVTEPPTAKDIQAARELMRLGDE